MAGEVPLAVSTFSEKIAQHPWTTAENLQRWLLDLDLQKVMYVKREHVYLQQLW
uniref:Uncharacterized protein n=1 Tax=Arion vulgaris TaxID=1028688 RepID=A0A0B6YN15_9EUPU